MNFLYGLLGGAASAAVCFTVGYLLTVHTDLFPEATHFGVGLEPWNLPGTILGLATWGAVVWYTLKKQN